MAKLEKLCFLSSQVMYTRNVDRLLKWSIWLDYNVENVNKLSVDKNAWKFLTQFLEGFLMKNTEF